jgi:hypothetical protein
LGKKAQEALLKEQELVAKDRSRNLIAFKNTLALKPNGRGCPVWTRARGKK